MSHSLRSISISPPAIPLKLHKNTMPLSKLQIREASKVHFIDYSKILYCEASSNYSIIHTLEGKKILTSKPLCKILDALPTSTFIRIHSKYSINIQHLVAVTLSTAKNVVLEGNIELSISRRKFKDFKELLNL